MAGTVSTLLDQQAAPDFNDPLGLLKACHQRMLGFCDLLENIIEHIKEHGVDADVKKSAQKVHRYFSSAAVFHHMDEEQDLFPLLIGSSLKLATIIHGLKQEHIAINETWGKLVPVLARPASIEKTPEFNQWVAEFCTAYRQHIKTEEEDFLSIAQHMLSSEQLQQLGKSMKERREQLR
jgi:hemerythrin-like domain-containing protein